MSKTYKLNSKSNMKKFETDLMNDILSKAEADLYQRSYDIKCPNCNAPISAKPGRNFCSICGEEINLNLDISF